SGTPGRNQNRSTAHWSLCPADQYGSRVLQSAGPWPVHLFLLVDCLCKKRVGLFCCRSQHGSSPFWSKTNYVCQEIYFRFPCIYARQNLSGRREWFYKIVITPRRCLSKTG